MRVHELNHKGNACIEKYSTRRVYTVINALIQTAFVLRIARLRVYSHAGGSVRLYLGTVVL